MHFVEILLGLPLCREEGSDNIELHCINLSTPSWAGTLEEKETESTADGGVVHELGKQGREVVAMKG